MWVMIDTSPSQMCEDHLGRTNMTLGKNNSAIYLAARLQTEFCQIRTYIEGKDTTLFTWHCYRRKCTFEQFWASNIPTVVEGHSLGSLSQMECTGLPLKNRTSTSVVIRMGSPDSETNNDNKVSLEFRWRFWVVCVVNERVSDEKVCELKKGDNCRHGQPRWDGGWKWQRGSPT